MARAGGREHPPRRVARGMRRWRVAARAEQRSGTRRPCAPPAAAELRDAQITLIFTVAGLSELLGHRPERIRADISRQLASSPEYRA